MDSLGPVLIGIDGTQLTPESKEHLLHPLVGGVVLFTRNFESRAQIQQLTASVRELRDPQLLVAIDQEGGRVQRLKDGFTLLPALGKIGGQYALHPEKTLELAYWHGRVMAMEMLDCGIDISFAPVLDLDRGSSVIGDRAFSADPDVVIELGAAYLNGMHDGGMKATGKHFPGHGSVRADSHTHDVCDERSLSEIELSDMRPFAELAPDLDAMMIAHVEYPCLDSRPAGYSEVWLAWQLRRRIGFRGVIFSDDLGMHAAKTLSSLHRRASVSLQAGCDVVLVCQPQDVAELLAQPGEVAEHPDATEKICSLHGECVLPRGTLYGNNEGASADFQEWRQRLEQLN